MDTLDDPLSNGGATGAANSTNGGDASTKQRKGKTQKVYFQGGREARKEFDELLYDLVDICFGNTNILAHSGAQGARYQSHKLPSSKVLLRFQFKDLCQKALGAADYLIIGHHFHTVFVENIPVLNLSQLNWRTVSRLGEMSSQAYLVKQQRNISKSAESKAELLSQRKATVNIISSLGDSIHSKYLR